MLSQERLKKLLHYDPATGILTWLVTRGSVKAGRHVAGCPNKAGYLRIKIDGKLYYVHVIAWFYVHGEWLAGKIDHRDTVKAHNWIDNLRSATKSQNQANKRGHSDSRSGFKGVYWSKQKKKWAARICLNRKETCLGFRNTPEEAHALYCAAARETFGEFARFK